jgi:hypothetical protein
LHQCCRRNEGNQKSMNLGRGWIKASFRDRFRRFLWAAMRESRCFVLAAGSIVFREI